MRTLLVRLLLLPALVLVSACGRHHASGPPAPLVPAVLHVENHHWLDVDLYVLHDGQRGHLGTVTATSTKVFTIPRSMIGSMGEVRLIADPVGERGTLTTDIIVVKPGTQVYWTLESSLDRSSLSVY